MRTFVAALVLALALVACGGDAAEAPSSVTGTITEVEPDEGQPTSFAVETEKGDSYTIAIDPDLDYGFDLAHLHEHHESGDPVAVELEERDDTLYAQSIEDV